MAVSAVFRADFTAFTAAVQNATVRLDSFEEKIGSVDTGLKRFGNKFGGTKIIQDATLMEKAIRDLGGVSKLTDAELARVGNTAKEAVDKMRALGVDVPGHLQALTTYAGGASDAFSKASIAVGSFVGNLAASAVQQFGSVLAEAAKDGAKFAAMAPAFDTLTASLGETSDVMLSMTRGATKGLISDLDLMQSTNKAVLLGLPVTSAEMSKLASAAVSLGRAMGQDATKSLDDLITALGRSSPMILDNLGLTVKVGEANEAYARQLGKSADAMTEAEKKTAFYNAAMTAAEKKTADLGDVSLTLTDQFGRIGTAMSNLVTRFAAGVNQSEALTGAFDAIASASERAATLADVQTEAMQKLRLEMKKTAEQGTGLARLMAREGIEDPDQLEAEIQRILIGRSVDLATARRPSVAVGAPFSGLGASASPLNDLTLKWQSEKLEEELKKRATADSAEEQRQKRIREKFGSVTGEELERMIFGFTAEEAAAMAREHARLMAATPFVLPGEIQRRDPRFDDELGLRVPDAMLLGGMGTHLKEEQARGYTQDTRFNLSKFLGANLGPTILQALTGGGDVGRSVAGLVGGGLTEKIFGGVGNTLTKSISGGLSKVLGSSISGALSSVLPGIGALAGPAISAIGKGLGKLFGFGGEGKETNRTRDSVLGEMFGSQNQFRDLAAAAGVADAEIRKVFSASKVKDFEAALANVTKQMDQFTSEQEADAARLSAAIEKYGISFEQAGAAFQKQELDKQAKELIEDWRVLVGSGIDLTLVNDKMSEAINQYLQTAVRVGQEIPNAFKPILQKMVEQGTLTDEAGNAITDMEAAGIQFAESMTQGFDRVVTKLDELIAKLVAAGTAMEGLGVPSVDVPLPTFPDPTTVELTPFAKGTGGRYLDFKDGTPVMLHGREKITPEGAEDGSTGIGVLAARLDTLSDDFRRAMDRLPIALTNALLTSRA